jgi:hypothetical protein
VCLKGFGVCCRLFVCDVHFIKWKKDLLFKDSFDRPEVLSTSELLLDVR